MPVNIVKLIQQAWFVRLAKQGIPLSESKWTPDQAKTAAMELWAVQNEVILAASGLTLAGLAVK